MITAVGVYEAVLNGKRVGWLDVSIDTRQGKVRSKWTYTSDGIRYEITTPSAAKIVIGNRTHYVESGNYTFWHETNQ